MRVAVLGTGDVGRRIGSRLIEVGHEVRLGSRTSNQPAAAAWAAETGGTHGNFAEASAWSELAFLCVSGQHALEVVAAAAEGLTGKVLIDVTNPLDFSRGFPPRLSVMNDDSLGEQIQRAAPGVRVVKALNTMANAVMVEPGRVPGRHDVLICGDDASAKGVVAGLLREFGWGDPIDLGPISGSRGLEAWLLLWTRLYAALGTGEFNLAIQRR